MDTFICVLHIQFKVRDIQWATDCTGTTSATTSCGLTTAGSYLVSWTSITTHTSLVSVTSAIHVRIENCHVATGNSYSYSQELYIIFAHLFYKITVTFQTFPSAGNVHWYWHWFAADFADKTDYLGCYKDCSGRTMASLEGSTGLLNDNAQARSDPITKCYYVARWHNYQVFTYLSVNNCFYHMRHPVPICYRLPPKLSNRPGRSLQLVRHVLGVSDGRLVFSVGILCPERRRVQGGCQCAPQLWQPGCGQWLCGRRGSCMPHR